MTELELATTCLHRRVECWYAPPYIEVDCVLCGETLDPRTVSIDYDEDKGRVLLVDGVAREIAELHEERR